MNAGVRAAVLATMLVTLCLVFLPAAGAETGPVQWSPTDGGNGHWYQLSPRPIEGMEDATQLAGETTFMGQPGYVVSVLSEGEKDFLVEAFGSEEQYVIGITDDEEGGVWKWVGGEPSGYTFWASGEPNDYMGDDYAVMNWQHEPNPEMPEPPGAWNDLPEAYGIAIFEYDAIAVSIDIRPGSDVNPINPRAKGVVPVAILTTDTFDATTVDPASVVFGPDAAAKAHKEAHVLDVNYDGDLDLLFHFAVAETGIASGDTAACLEGYTYDGLFLTGCDYLTTVPAAG